MIEILKLKSSKDINTKKKIFKIKKKVKNIKFFNNRLKVYFLRYKKRINIKLIRKKKDIMIK